MKVEETPKSESATDHPILQKGVDKLDLRLERYVCLNHIALLEQVAESNLKELIDDVSQNVKEVYDRLKKNQEDRVKLIQRLITKIEQGGQISPEDDDQKELQKVLKSIDQDMRHPRSLRDDERLRYSYYKQIEPLLISESNSDALTKGRSQFLDKRKVRTFLWDLLRLHIQDFCNDYKDYKNRKSLLSIYEPTIKYYLVTHTKYDDADTPYDTWEEKYIKDLTTLQKLLDGDFKDNKSQKYTARLSLLNELFRVEKKKRGNWGERSRDHNLTVDPEDDPADDPERNGLALDTDYAYAEAQINKYVKQLGEPINDIGRATSAILIEHYEKQKDKAAKKYYAKNKLKKIKDDYKKGLSKWTSPGQLLFEHSEAIQGMLGARLGYAWGKGDASQVFNWKFGAELGLEISGVFLATVPGGIFVKSLLSGLIEGGFEGNKKPNEVLAKIEELKNHIDQKFELRNLEEKSNLELTKIRGIFDKLEILDDATFKDFVNGRLEYDYQDRAESLALKKVREFLESLDKRVSTLLVSVYGCGVSDFLDLKVPVTDLTEIGYLIEKKKGQQEYKDTKGYTLFNIWKKHHSKVPHQYTVLDLKDDVDYMVSRAQGYLDLLLQCRNYLLPLVTDLYALEKHTWKIDPNDKKANGTKANGTKAKYRSTLKQGLKFDTSSRKDFHDLKAIKAQMDKTLALLIGGKNAISLQAIKDGSYFELHPKHAVNLHLSASHEGPYYRVSDPEESYNWLVLMPATRISNRGRFKYLAASKTIVTQQSNVELMLSAANLKVGEPIRVFDKDNRENKYRGLYLSLEKEDGYFSIIVVHEKEKLGLEVKASKKSEYTKVTLGKECGGDNQQFALQIIDSKLSQVKTISELLSAKTKCTAHFVPGDTLNPQVRYYGMKQDGSLGSHYVILNIDTNNLEIWRDYKGGTSKKENKMVWCALDQPPGVGYMVEARFSHDGNLSIYQIPDPLRPKVGQDEQHKEVWSTHTSGNPFTDLRLLDMGDQSLLVISNAHNWSIWRSDENEWAYTKDFQLIKDGTAFLHNQVALLAGKTHSFKHASYMPTTAGADNAPLGVSQSSTVDVYLTIKKNQLCMTQHGRGHSTPGADSRFRFILEDAHRSLFRIMSVNHEGKYLELTGNHSVEKDLSKIKCQLELKDYSKSSEGQLFFVQYLPTVVKGYRNTLSDQKKESEPAKTIVRPLQLLNKRIPIDCRNAWYDGSATYERSINYDGTQIPQDGNPFYIKFLMTRMVSENFVDKLSDFMTSDMKAMCYNKDLHQYVLFSDVSYYIRKNDQAGVFAKGVYMDGDPIYARWWNLPGPYFDMRSAIYIYQEKSFYWFYGEHGNYVKISDSGETEMGNVDRWSVPGRHISSVCYDSRRGTLHFFYGGEYFSGYCNSCYYRGEVQGMNPHKINKDWPGLPAKVYRAVVYVDHDDSFYFFDGDMQYKVSGEQVADKPKLVSSHDW